MADGLVSSVPDHSEVESDVPAQPDRHKVPCYVYESRQPSNGMCRVRRALPPTLSPTRYTRNVCQSNRPTQISKKYRNGDIPTRENIAALIWPTCIVDTFPGKDLQKGLRKRMNRPYHQSLAGLLLIRQELL